MLKACNFIKKRLWHRCFPVNFAKFFRTLFLQNTGRLFLENSANYTHLICALLRIWFFKLRWIGFCYRYSFIIDACVSDFSFFSGKTWNKSILIKLNLHILPLVDPKLFASLYCICRLLLYLLPVYTFMLVWSDRL